MKGGEKENTGKKKGKSAREKPKDLSRKQPGKGP